MPSSFSTRAVRLARRVRTRLRSPQPLFVQHPEYSIRQGAIVDHERSQKILRYLLMQGCIDRRFLVLAPDSDVADLKRVHDLKYLEQVDADPSIAGVFGEVAEGFDVRELLAMQRRMVGGTCVAAQRALAEGKQVVHLGGGLHHAHHDRGGGFCLFNDIAVAIAKLRVGGFDKNILVVDLDLHPGDGTRALFAEDPTVFTFSMHAVEWESCEARADRSVALGLGVGDVTYLAALDKHLPQVFAEAAPAMVFYVAGVDIADDDAMGNWRVGSAAIAERDRRVVEAAAGLPLVWTLAGGYGPDAWRHSARSLAWLSGGFDAPIPSAVDGVMDRWRSIARMLSRAELTGNEEGGLDDLELSVEDVLGDLFKHNPSAGRYLGYYSPFGLEVAFERYGVTDALSALGYAKIRLILDTEHPTGHRMQVRSDDHEDLLLVELVLREHRRHSPWRLLFIEWLLLQNPRKIPKRPLLPGQEYPGLGILDKVVGMLLMACERLGFDGLAFHPSAYHMASIARSSAVFLDPVEQGRFAAASAALEGVELGRASTLVQRGLLKNSESGEPFVWSAELMVAPLSAGLNELLDSESYEREVEGAAAAVGPFELSSI